MERNEGKEMLSESEKRAIFLAVSRLIPDARLVQKAISSGLASRPGIDSESILASLVKQNLLTPNQAYAISQSIRDKNLGGNGEGEEDLIGSSTAPTMLAMKAEYSKQGTDDSQEASPERLGHYKILRKLGQGGMCSVFLAFDESSSSQVAIKLLPPKLAANQITLDRFYREGRSGILLQHPNIVQNFDFGQDQITSQHYLVMEYVDGFTGQELLGDHGKLSVADSIHIVLNIARGLEHAHSRNIIHRDIKPDNILITRTGISKLADLGLAKRTDETSHLTSARQGFGTPWYMPYEQAINARGTDGRSDIYALGATFYHFLTGEVPFKGDSHLEIVEQKKIGKFPPASSINSEIPQVLDGILERMMAVDPRHRYQTMSELIIDLERTNLIPMLPSFIDPELAYQDPIVRERMASLTQQTRADLSGIFQDQNGYAHTDDLWYIQFRTKTNKSYRLKGSTAQVIKRLQERKIPLSALASREPNGKYISLKEVPEFKPHFLKKTKKVKPANNSASKSIPNEIPEEEQTSGWLDRLRKNLGNWW
ncbi:MAG: serine/threonine protein kinase [Bdellovibrionales bacterium]